MFLMALGVGCRSGTGSETVPGEIFESINFRGLGFIHKYSENVYTVKVRTYTVTYSHTAVANVYCK